MSEPFNPFDLSDAHLIDWCERERVSYAGMEALRRVAQLGTRYRWDATRRGTEVTRAGSRDLFFPHDWLERALEERDAARAALVLPVVEPAAVVPAAPTAPAPAARQTPRTTAPARPQAGQLGLFGGGR